MTASVGCGGISRLRRPSPASDVQQRQLPQRQRSLFPSLALGDPNPPGTGNKSSAASSGLPPSLDKGDGESDPWWSRAYRRQRRRGGFLPLFSEVRDLLKATVESDTIFNRGGARVLSRPLMSAADTVRVGVFGPVGHLISAIPWTSNQRNPGSVDSPALGCFELLDESVDVEMSFDKIARVPGLLWTPG
nr:hypothetical protein Iba_chr04aCG15980 [Ipomoea batatas]